MPSFDYQMRLRSNATMQEEAFKERADLRHATVKIEVTGASLSTPDQAHSQIATRDKVAEILDRALQFHSTNHEGDEEIG